MLVKHIDAYINPDNSKEFPLAKFRTSNYTILFGPNQDDRGLYTHLFNNYFSNHQISGV
jgi:hypothetical protein